MFVRECLKADCPVGIMGNVVFPPQEQCVGQHLITSIFLEQLTENQKEDVRRLICVNCGFIETTGSWDFTSSWTHRRCDHDGRWSWCADRVHAGWKGRKKSHVKLHICDPQLHRYRGRHHQISYPQKCRRPRWARIFFSLSRSSLSLLSRPLARTWNKSSRHHEKPGNENCGGWRRMILKWRPLRLFQTLRLNLSQRQQVNHSCHYSAVRRCVVYTRHRFAFRFTWTQQLYTTGPNATVLTHLAVFAILDILLPVEEPVWDFVLTRILHDGHHTFHLKSKLRLLVPAQTDQTSKHSILKMQQPSFQDM